MRVWLPDRPGALGAVASRIGAVKGDVVGIEILETGEGQAVDELVVTLPDGALMDLLVGEVRQVDGVAVEEIRHLGNTSHDPRAAMLETVAEILKATNRDELATTTCVSGLGSLSASWIAVLDTETNSVVASGDDAPDDRWISAFAAGSSSGDGQLKCDVIVSRAEAAPTAIVAGRDTFAWRERERRELDALSQIVGTRWAELPN